MWADCDVPFGGGRINGKLAGPHELCSGAGWFVGFGDNGGSGHGYSAGSSDTSSEHDE